MFTIVQEIPPAEGWADGSAVIVKPNGLSHDNEGLYIKTGGEWQLWAFPKPQHSLLGYDRMKVSTSDVLDAIDFLIDVLPDDIDEDDEEEYPTLDIYATPIVSEWGSFHIKVIINNKKLNDSLDLNVTVSGEHSQSKTVHLKPGHHISDIDFGLYKTYGLNFSVTIDTPDDYKLNVTLLPVTTY